MGKLGDEGHANPTQTPFSVSQAVSLGLLSPPFLQPLDHSSPLPRSPGPRPQMSQSLKETQCIVPDYLHRQHSPDLTDSFAQSITLTGSTAGPGHGFHPLLSKVTNENMKVLTEVSPGTSHKFQKLVAAEPLNQGARGMLTARLAPL